MFKTYRVLAATLLSLACTYPAHAGDDASADYAEDSAIEEIIVTGTRIPRLDYESASPLVTVDSSLFEQSGSPSVATMLNTLPQFTPWMTETVIQRTGPNPPGQAIMDLRGLGFGRTLVLLDGQRIVPSNAYGAVDVNLIPSAIVDTVEIITGGASAVYGSDAIAGVVNFKTRRFSGLQTDISWEQTDLGDGTGWHAGITGGLEFSRGFAYGHLSVAERDPIMQADRSVSRYPLEWDEELVIFGSPYIRQGTWFPMSNNRMPQEAIDTVFSAADSSYTPGALGWWTWMGFNPDGTLFSLGPVYNFRGDWNEPLQPVIEEFYSYNYAGDTYLRYPSERANFFGRAGLEIGESAEAFLQLLYASYTPDLQMAALPLGGVWVAADNPFVSPDFATLLQSRPDPDAPFRFGKRLTDLGNRRFENDYDVMQVTLGISGNLLDSADWRYDGYASHGSVDRKSDIYNFVSRNAFETLSFAPDAGATICGGSGMNPFGINSISPECADYIRRNGRQESEVRQRTAEFTLSGPVIELPAGDVNIAAGVFYKQDEYRTKADAIFSEIHVDPVTGRESRDVGGSEPIDGQTRSRELYLEANLPIFMDAPLADSLEATVGARIGDHSNSGTVEAWKAETIWQIAAPLAFRSSIQQAVRAPDFISLFEPQLVSQDSWFFSGPEPCSSDFQPEDDLLGAPQDPDVAALCVAQGIPESVLPTYVDATRAAESLSGGNPALREETAETITAGFVIRPMPTVLEGLQVSIDYYRIEVKDIAAYLGFPVFACFAREANPTLDPGNIYCQQFERDPVTYEVSRFALTPVNMAEMSVSGYDLQADYSRELDRGDLHLNVVASYTDHATEKAGPLSPEHDFVGKATGHSLFAQSAFFSLVPRFKMSAGADYSTGPYEMNLRWRYISSLYDDWIDWWKLPSRQYVDVSFAFSPIEGALEGLVLRGGVTNLLDTEPVVYPSWVEANTEPSTYDVLGRRYYLRLSYRF